jgi:hypothetical protein
MGCGFGAHLNSSGIDTMQRLWPKWYDMVMNYENNGIRYGDALRKVIERSDGRLDLDSGGLIF